VREREEFVDFVAATLPGLRRLAWSLVGDRHRSEDALQATLERLYLAWPRIEIRDPVAYARAALVRQVAEERRRMWRRREVSAGSVPDYVPTERALADVVADRVLLLELLAQLPPRQRHTVVLRYLEDLPVAEVATLLRCTEGTVKRAAHDGLRSLRAALASVGADQIEEIP
jgi:RNA polymerase sigma-70 factor (sigma-E family)